MSPDRRGAIPNTQSEAHVKTMSQLPTRNSFAIKTDKMTEGQRQGVSRQLVFNPVLHIHFASRWPAAGDASCQPARLKQIINTCFVLEWVPMGHIQKNQIPVPQHLAILLTEMPHAL